MSKSTEREQWKSALEAREYVLGNRQNRPDDVLPHTGVIGDKQIREFLTMCQIHFDPNKADIDVAQFKDTKLYQMLVKRYGTETLTNAIKGDNPQVQSFFVGNPGDKSDISGMHAIDNMRTIVGKEAPIIYIWGPPGSGKTNFAILLAQMWKRYHNENGLIGTNIKTLEQKDVWIEQWHKLKKWLTDNITDIQGGGETLEEDATNKLYIFDEASTHANASGKEGWETRSKLSPMVYKIRKAGAGLIIIGHDGKDVDPSVRTLATCIQKFKDNKKKARFFDDVKERKGFDEYSFSPLKNIPQTDWYYDDKEATSFQWTESEDDEEENASVKDEKEMLEEAERIANEMLDEKLDELIGKMYVETSDKVTMDLVAQTFDVSTATVSRKADDYKDEIARRQGDAS
jgi:hypothetical protein